MDGVLSSTRAQVSPPIGIIVAKNVRVGGYVRSERIPRIPCRTDSLIVNRPRIPASSIRADEILDPFGMHQRFRTRRASVELTMVFVITKRATRPVVHMVMQVLMLMAIVPMEGVQIVEPISMRPSVIREQGIVETTVPMVVVPRQETKSHVRVVVVIAKIIVMMMRSHPQVIQQTAEMDHDTWSITVTRPGHQMMREVTRRE
jgi:hypothetical protein